MGDSDKRECVRLQFERFSKLCPDIPSGEVQIWEDASLDPPDVCIGNGILGIEFTDFHHGKDIAGIGSEPRIIQAELKKILGKAEERFKATNTILLSVLLVWHKDIRLNNLPKRGLDQAIATAISSSILQLEYGDTVIKGDALGGSLENYIESIWITRLPADTTSSWRNMNRGRIDVGVESLEPFVRKKEGKLQTIRNKCNAAWLVIVGTDESVATSISLNYDVVPGCITSGFDRIYLLDMLLGEIVCLTTNQN